MSAAATTDGDGERLLPKAASLEELLNSCVGETIMIANEFTATEIRRIETRNGSRLLIVAPRSGQWVTLDALEIEALTWQNTRTLAAMVGNMHAPLMPDDEVGL